jgi:GTPase
MKPIIALVGRPNVGKSTLFNRLVGERMAIVDETPGTTRDRLFGESEWNGRQFTIVDTGGIDRLTAVAHRFPSGSVDFIDDIRRQAQAAIQEADAVLFVNDGEAGVTEPDREVADILRRITKETTGWDVFCRRSFWWSTSANQGKGAIRLLSFMNWAWREPFAISAIHGTSTGDLLDALVESLPEQTDEEEDNSVKIAIVGKPNAGKSSLLNRLVGEERVIVSPIAGTTRDAIDMHHRIRRSADHADRYSRHPSAR